jgi:uncharacterized protein (DUF1810 family)
MGARQSDDNTFDPEIFLEVQRKTYSRALQELQAGRKEGHWMWFVFPQLRGLGKSFYADLYGLDGLEDARMYLAHPTLGPRLVQCVEATLKLEHLSANQVFGTPDDLKFYACLTLFNMVLPSDVFHQGLVLFYDGASHRITVDMLRGDGGSFKSILRRLFR